MRIMLSDLVLCSALILGGLSQSYSQSIQPLTRNEVHQFDSFLPYPDRASLSAIEILHSREDVEAVIDSIYRETLFPMTTLDATFLCFEGGMETANQKTSEKPVPESSGKLIAASDEDLIYGMLKEELAGNCFEKRVNYWTYVFCPFEKMEQVRYEMNHRQAGKKIKTQVIDLGSFSSLTSNSTFQIFQGGTDSRQTVVKLICPTATRNPRHKRKDKKPSTSKVGKIKYVSEAEPYMYRVTFETELVCDDVIQAYLAKARGHPETELTTQYDELSSEEVEREAGKIMTLLKEQCLIYSKGWWTYELCFNQFLRQFHKNKDGSLDEFHLGYYSSEQSKQSTGAMISHSSKYGRKVITQEYTEGTECDLTGKKRHTTVTLLCMSTIGFVEIVGIEESVSCGYSVTISLPALCSLAGFSGSSHSQKALTLGKIICIPEQASYLIQG